MALLVTGCAFYADVPNGRFGAALGESTARAGACSTEPAVGASTQPLEGDSAIEVRGAAVSSTFGNVLTHTIDAVVGFFRPQPTVIVQPAAAQQPAPEPRVERAPAE